MGQHSQSPGRNDLAKRQQQTEKEDEGLIRLSVPVHLIVDPHGLTHSRLDNHLQRHLTQDGTLNFHRRRKRHQL